MRNFSISLVACIVAVLPVVKAQDCSNWTNWDLRGTYTLYGSGFIDLSKAFPGAGLPSGMTPYYWVGKHTYDGKGGESTPGWISMNFGGNQLTGQYVTYTYSMKADCSVVVTSSVKFTELGVTTPIQTSLKVVVRKPDGALELPTIITGTPFGTSPSPTLGLEVMHRIAIQ